MRITIPATVAFLATSLLAQIQNPIGYPSDTVRAGSGNLVPFGLSSSTNFDEGRWQQLIPAQLLPSTGCIFTGMAVNCQSSNATVTYTSIQITLSHTTATSLGNSFSGNLPAPLLVFSVTNFPISWSINKWVPINFSLPFPYNGTDNLVVQIQKVYDRVANPVPGIVTHQTSGAPSRNDLSPSKYAFSPLGSGGSTTDTVGFTSMPVSLRLYCSAQGTTTIASPQATNAEFQVNTSMTTTVWAATGSPFVTLIDFAFNSPVTIPPIAGSLRVSGKFVFTTGATSNGSSALTLQIPNDPALVGAYLTLQSLVISPGLTSLAWTNGVDFFVNA